MKNLFIEVIESVTPNQDYLMWQYDGAGKEIKNGAALTVRESQHVLLLDRGQLADVFPPGLHKLSTENIPILTNLRNWHHGFNSPFMVDVYYFNTHQFVNLKWGTPAPIIMPDAKFGQVRIKAFGAYNIRICDVVRFFRQYAGTTDTITIYELERQMRDFIAPKFGEVLANHGYSIMDVAGNITELSNKVLPQLQPFFNELGLELLKFQITSVTLPEEVTKHYDTVTSMNMVGDMNKFQQFNTAQAIGQQGTAMNEGTQAAAMMGAMMGQMNQMMQQQQSNQQAAPAEEDIVAKLKKLKDMFDMGLLDEDEFKAKKAELLSKL
ncbi:SPFH domain-containing protein [Prevotella sp. 10(H)]|uniref:SPFH domain-containing protein n=1 Tax=Prevotella sp. 10(H) TaxID=1158294 RepID=UPI0004A6FA0A|nr:SPFH domain-containing protein [Prevotella sp. 10(H)]